MLTKIWAESQMGTKSALMFCAVRWDLCCSGCAAGIFTRSLTLTTQALWEITLEVLIQLPAAVYRPPSNGAEASWKLWLDVVFVCLFLPVFISSKASPEHLWMCISFVFVWINFELMLRGSENIHFAVGTHKWVAWDSEYRTAARGKWRKFQGRKRTEGYHSCCADWFCRAWKITQNYT